MDTVHNSVRMNPENTWRPDLRKGPGYQLKKLYLSLGDVFGRYDLCILAAQKLGMTERQALLTLAAVIRHLEYHARRRAREAMN